MDTVGTWWNSYISGNELSGSQPTSTLRLRVAREALQTFTLISRSSGCHTIGYQGIFRLKSPETSLPYPYEALFALTVFPTVGSMDYPPVDYSNLPLASTV